RSVATLDGIEYRPSLDGWDGQVEADGRVSVRFSGPERPAEVSANPTDRWTLRAPPRLLQAARDKGETSRLWANALRGRCGAGSSETSERCRGLGRTHWGEDCGRRVRMLGMGGAAKSAGLWDHLVRRRESPSSSRGLADSRGVHRPRSPRASHLPQLALRQSG